ncbi:MAG: GGDEF domain-containing protein [Mariprofundus sp.]
MSNAMPTQDVQQLATSLASVANNAKQVDLLILGGGRGGLAMLEVLQHYDWVNIHSIVDISEEAVAFPMARASGIHTSVDRELTFKQFHGDIVIDVTGDSSMAKTLAPGLRLRQIELIAGKSAKLLFDLVNEQLRNEKTIHIQNARLDLLDSMLDITMQLENRPPLTDIINASLINLHSHVNATKGLAVIFNNDGSGDIVSAIGTEKPSCNLAACAPIQAVCSELTEYHRFKTLPQPIKLHCSKTPKIYTTILPLWQGNRLAAALLMDLPGRLSRAQRTGLNMASIHLNMAAKTLAQYEQLENMAMFDGLTGTYNRHFFDQKLNEEINRIKRTKHGTLTCAFVDTDDFKQVNDTYGHPVGDKVLKEIASSISYCIRDYDVCARYGGDEFIILLPAESLEIHAGLEKVGLRILEHIANIKIPEAEALTVSVSIGMATLSAETLNAEELLKLADQAVYQAKKAGKSCLRIHAEEQFHLDGHKG